MITLFRLLSVTLLVFGLTLSSSSCADEGHAPYAGQIINSIYWSDGDSGRIDGFKFRLNSVDAPETGAVGRRGGALCEDERRQGYQAKSYMAALTNTGVIQIEQLYGTDRYGRWIVDLTVDGHDIGSMGITAGLTKKWKHKGRRALEPKPNYCKIVGKWG